MKINILIVFFMLNLLCLAPIYAQEKILANSYTPSMKVDSSSKDQDIKATFQFIASSFESSMEKIQLDELNIDLFGTEIAKKNYLMRKLYSYEVPIAPGETGTKSVFVKPTIYFSTIKIEKFLKKLIKSGKMTQDDACKSLNKVLDIALNISGENTDLFEKRLSAAHGDAESLLNIFIYEVKLNNQ